MTCNPQGSFQVKAMQVLQKCDFLLHNSHNIWDQKGTHCHVMLSLSKLGDNTFLWACEKPKRSILVLFGISLKEASYIFSDEHGAEACFKTFLPWQSSAVFSVVDGNLSFPA